MGTCCSTHVAVSCRISPSTTTLYIMICESHCASNNIGKQKEERRVVQEAAREVC